MNKLEKQKRKQAMIKLDQQAEVEPHNYSVRDEVGDMSLLELYAMTQFKKFKESGWKPPR